MMAWETRQRGGRYYCRTRREGGRRIREYVGRGIVGELAARMDAEQRAQRAEAVARRREARRQEAESARALGALLADLDAVATTLLVATLTTAGYHRQNRGPWRKRRERRTDR
jgi:hypothetical protein